MANAISDHEERDRWQRDPVAYNAIERLQDAYEQLCEALEVRVNETALRLSPNPIQPDRPREWLPEACERLNAAEAAWAAAVSNADAILHQRHEGGS